MVWSLLLLPKSKVTLFTTPKKVERQKGINEYFLFFHHVNRVLAKHGQVAHGDVERGHSGASWRPHLFAATRCPASHRPLRDWVRKSHKSFENIKHDDNTFVCIWALLRNSSDASVGCFCSFAGVAVCQPAGGECHPCEVHLWPVSGGLLEPCLHGHTGTQGLRKGETGQREGK